MNNFKVTGKAVIVDAAKSYAQTKFFRLMLDLFRLAQFDPLNPANVPLKPVDDNSLYARYGFSDAMINFTEEKFS